MLDGHRTAERRSLAYHRAVADRLDGEGLERARARVERWVADEGPVAPQHARRWQALLSGPLPQVAAALRDDDEAMRDLRQTTPFAGALPPRERWRIVREVR